MEDSRQKSSGKWGVGLMVTLFLFGMMVCFLAFVNDRPHLSQRSERLTGSRAFGPNYHGGEEFQATKFVPREQLSRAARDAEKKLQGIVRTVKVERAANGYWKPAKSPEGGYDMAPSIDRASKILSIKILNYFRVANLDGTKFKRIVVKPEEETGEPGLNMNLARRVRGQISDFGRVYVDRDDVMSGSLVFYVGERDHLEFGRILEVTGDRGVFRAAVICDPQMHRAPSAPRSRVSRQEISFRTDRQTEPEMSREDALDDLYVRIQEKIWREAIFRDYVGLEDRQDFLVELEDRFSREILCGMGRRSMQPVKTILRDDQANDEFVSFHTEVIWSGSRSRLRTIAEAIGDSIRTKERVPFIRLGLSLALCLLFLLSWLRVDWWLKGHHAILSKLLFVILAVMCTTAVWNYPFHG